MRTLFVTADVPQDGGSGGQIASWRLIDTYATFSEVDVIALVPPDARATPDLAARARRHAVIPLKHFHYGSAKLRLALKFARSQVGRPYRFRKFYDSRTFDTIHDWAQHAKYDLLHCDHLETVQYRAAAPGVPVLLMEHNVEWQLWQRYAATRAVALRPFFVREAGRTRAFEVDAVRSARHTLTLSEQDRQALIADDDHLCAKVSVWPIPIPRRPMLERWPSGFNVLVLGSLRSGGRAHGLRWLLREVWAEVRARIPHAELHVVGAGPPRDIARRDGTDGIAIHGFVEDIEPILAATHVCAIPLAAGAGIRVKILELISRGIPCVGSPVATQGNERIPGVATVTTPAEWVAYFEDAYAHYPALRSTALRGALELCRRNSRAAARASLESAVASAVRHRSCDRSHQW